MTMSKSLSEQVANLETYLAEALVENRYLEAENAKLRQRRTDLAAANAELRAGRGRWPEKADDFPCCEPVTAETIRASEPGSTWEDEEGEVFEWTGRQLRWQVDADGLGKSNYINIVEDGELVRSTAAPRGDYSTPPRLTVHALNVAPAGSWIVRPGFNSRCKYDSGKWRPAWLFPGRSAETSEDLIADGWADATLRLPEDQS